MEKWVVVGAGGFVEGSLLPHFKGKIGGIITNQPLKSIGVSRAYGLKLYGSLVDAKSDGCNVVYICSSSWTHLSWILEGITAKMKVISEKPIVISVEQLEILKKMDLQNCFGAMIKRANPALKDIASKNHIVFNIFAQKGLQSMDYLDSRRGGFLLVELVHYLDIAFMLAGKSAKYTAEGNRYRGQIVVSGRKKVVINYDFDHAENSAPFPFDVNTIFSLTDDPEKVLIPMSDLIELYSKIFCILEMIS